MRKSTYSSLMDAIQSNDLAAFRSILQSESSLRSGVWWMDYDLLTRAMALDRKPIVDYLLENGCRVWKPYDKTSPLHVAVAKEWHDVVRKLLCQGARASAKDAAGDTAVHLAFKNSAPGAVLDALIESFLDETSTSVRDEEELGVLHIVCTRPRMQFVRQFFQFRQTSIDSQVSLNSNSSHAGYTPLHFAVEHGRHEVAAYLLERGADLYLQDRNGSTPLHLALEYCDVKMVNLICYYVSKFDNVVNSRGLSHFMAACASNDPSLVEKYLCVSNAHSLISNRVSDVTGYPFAGYTPLHFAAVHDRVHTARLLLHCHGEQLFWAATARNHHTAASLAFESKRYRMAKLFSAYCEGGDAWTKEVAKIDKKSVVRRIEVNVAEESFQSCCDFLEGIEGVENACEVDLDETLPVSDSDDDDDEEKSIDESVVSAKKMVEKEASIDETPRSTRSLYGKRDEMFLTRVQELHLMSQRFFFNADKTEDERSEGASLFGFLVTARPVKLLIGTLLLWSLLVGCL